MAEGRLRELLARLREHLSAGAALRDELSDRLDAWMRATADPLLDGPVPAPAGSLVNHPSARSAEEQTLAIEAGAPLAGVA